MIAAYAVGCGLIGLVVGWLLDPLVTTVPQRREGIAPDVIDIGERGPRRILVTLVTAATFAALGAVYAEEWVLLAYLVLTAGLVLLATIDLLTYLLPNLVLRPLTAVVLVLLALAAMLDDDPDAIGRALLAGVIVFVIFLVLHLVSPRSMGFGDVKLSFVLGASLGYLGWGVTLVGIFLGFLFGAVVGIVLIVTKLRARSEPVPFGPFLAAGTVAGLLVGEALVTWYRGG